MKVSSVLTCALACAVAAPLRAQNQTASVRVEVRGEAEALAGASVTANGTRYVADRSGVVSLTVAPGRIDITVVKDGYLPATAVVEVGAGERRDVRVELHRLEEQVIVTATRTNTRLQDQPVRVEVIDREEIEEKALMTPGNVAMLVGETTGLRVQTTAPSLGAANVRIQGLRGRYSQLIADGLPLYGTQGDSFSLLQVPPLDLGQVEVIKGVASALYGASALGGVINLVSRRPRENERQLLVNATSQTGRDLALWLARAPAAGWSWTLLGGYNGQDRRDLDGDGWSDVPTFNRGMLRPRLFFESDRGTSLLATLGVMAEDRAGGTLAGHVAPDGRPFRESLASRHVDGGVVGRWVIAGSRILAVRGSAMRRSQTRQFGDTTERGVRATWFGEASLQALNGRHTWVAGTSFQQDRFDLRELPAFNYRFSSPSVFGQDEIAFGRKWTLALSARADVHSEYGTLATPRISLLARPTPAWTIRLAAGTGAFAPTPFTEETEETGLSRLAPLHLVRAEHARGASFDLTRRAGPWEITGTVFGSIVNDPLEPRVIDGSHVGLANVNEPTRTWGTELLARFRSGEFRTLITHGWTRSTELDPDLGVRRDVPLTPGHVVSFTTVWEAEEWGRLGIEGYFTGRQMLDENPYRSVSAPYFLIGAMGERKWRGLRFFLNAENLLGVRQTRYDPLVLRTQRPDGRWTVDAWAPLDGLVINGGVRLYF